MNLQYLKTINNKMLIAFSSVTLNHELTRMRVPWNLKCKHIRRHNDKVYTWAWYKLQMTQKKFLTPRDRRKVITMNPFCPRNKNKKLYSLKNKLNKNNSRVAENHWELKMIKYLLSCNYLFTDILLQSCAHCRATWLYIIYVSVCIYYVYTYRTWKCGIDKYISIYDTHVPAE